MHHPSMLHFYQMHASTARSLLCAPIYTHPSTCTPLYAPSRCTSFSMQLSTHMHMRTSAHAPTSQCSYEVSRACRGVHSLWTCGCNQERGHACNQHAQSACAISMCNQHVQSACAISMRCAISIQYGISMCNQHVRNQQVRIIGRICRPATRPCRL